MTFTPGPWKVSQLTHNKAWVVMGEGGGAQSFRIAYTAPTLHDPDSEREMEANARLIAAAPTLLNMCQTLLTMIEVNGLRGDVRERGSDWVLRQDISVLLDRARAAIARATGDYCPSAPNSVE